MSTTHYFCDKHYKEAGKLWDGHIESAYPGDTIKIDKGRCEHLDCVKWRDIVDKRRVIPCVTLNGVKHIIRRRKGGGYYLSYCGKLGVKSKLLAFLQKPEDIDCSDCAKEYINELRPEYDELIRTITQLRNEALSIRDTLEGFEKQHEPLDNKSAPSPHESKLGNLLGRPQEGKYKKCKGCEKSIYVRPFRDREDGNYCKTCANKMFQPPVRVKGDERAECGISERSRCPKCRVKSFERDGTDLHCWMCGHIIYHVFAEGVEGAKLSDPLSNRP